MTNQINALQPDCPKYFLLKKLIGKWKTCNFRYATQGSVGFGQILKLLPEVTSQSITNALKEPEENGLPERKVIQLKPLHVEYHLTEPGTDFLPIFKAVEELNLLPVNKK